MMILENKIDIQASREKVWQVTTDVGSWPLWSPAMQKIVREDSGDFKLGSSALIKQMLMPKTRWVVTHIKSGECFTCQTNVLGIQMVATHLIIPNDSAVTSVLKIKMKGGIAKLLWPLIKAQVLRALQEENAGLKQFCESRS